MTEQPLRAIGAQRAARHESFPGCADLRVPLEIRGGLEAERRVQEATVRQVHLRRLDLALAKVLFQGWFWMPPRASPRPRARAEGQQGFASESRRASQWVWAVMGSVAGRPDWLGGVGAPA
jgi:hypothetical protein